MDERTAVTPAAIVKQIPTKGDRTKRGKWLRRFGIAFMLLCLVGMFAPTILTMTVLRRGVPKMLEPMLHVKTEWSGLSLGWFSPIVVSDLKVVDQDARPLLDVQKISTSHPLWTLIARSTSLGTLTIVEPVLHVSLRNDGSNVEDLIAKFSQGSTPANDSNKPSSSTAIPSVTVEIEDARIELEHKESNKKSSLEQIALHLVSTKGAVDELELTIGRPAGDAQLPADASTDWLQAHYGSPTDEASGTLVADTKQAVLRASHWKLDWVAPGLARVMPKAEFTGELNADASVELIIGSNEIDWDWNGAVSIEKLVIAGIDALKQDKLAFEQVQLSGRAAVTQGRLAMNELKVTADVGELSATGDFPLDMNSQKSTAELVQSLLSDEDYHVAGNIDLKKLATMLPQTLRIRDGIEIHGGEVKVQVVGDDSNGVRRWSAVAGIVGLVAENNGKPIPWDKPVAAHVAAHRDKSDIVVDQLECKSDFLQVKGSGTLDNARFTATGDLDKLLEKLEQFVDLGIQQLTGQMKAEGQLRRVNDDRLALMSRIQLDNFAYDVSKNNVWHEKHLELTINAEGLANPTIGLTRVDVAELHLISGGDTCDSKILQPIELSSKSPVYSIAADVKGKLATWQNRLRPFVALSDWKLDGNLNVETTVSANSQQVDVKKFSIVLANLEVDGPGLIIQDPEMTLATAGRWEFAAQKWTSAKTSLVGHAISVEVDGLECALGKQGIARLVGTVDYEADLKQVSKWINDAAEQPSYYLLGSLTGKARITQEETVMTAKLDTQIEKLVIAGLTIPPEGKPTWTALWKEPALKVTAAANYDSAADRMTLDSSSIDVDGLSVGAKGSLAACSTKQQLDLSGDLAYDWDRLVKRFGDALGAHIQLSGKDHRPFSVKGSLASLASTPTPKGKTNATPVSFNSSSTTPDHAATGNGIKDFTGQAGVGWSAANVYGIVAGPGDISAKLDQGIVQFAPLDMVVNEGKLHLTPTVYLDREPAILLLPQEKVIDQIRLSPELCSGWLKFVVPALADSAQVEGKFSLDMNGASVPLADPKMGNVDGTLSVHQVQVRPGPLALKIVGALDQVQTIISRRPLGDLSKDVWLEMPEQQIPFKVMLGRVHHEGMTFTVKNVAVKTSGSVGLDETLALVAEIPVRDEWLGSNKIFAGLKGQTVQVPINGTLTNPQLDPRVFSKLTQQVGGSVLEGVLKDKVGDKLDGALNDGLNRLLKGKK